MTISVTQLDRDFSAMSTLKPLAAAGKGNVAAILPDTVTSARYTEFDAPYLTQALTAAGLSSSQFSVQNAQGSDATELSDAQAAITKGASVLIMDPLDSGVGAQIETYAKAHGVKVIDYDRLTLGGSRDYYVSFNNVLVGTKIGQGFTACAAAWHVAKPNVLVMKGDPTDNNATLFAQGYLAVLNPLLLQREVRERRRARRDLDADGRGERIPAGSSPRTRTSTPSSRRTMRTPPRSSPTCSGWASSPRPSRSPGRTRPWSGCRTSWPATSAAPSTSRSTSRPRPPWRWPCSCARARPRRAALVNGSVTDTKTNTAVPSVLVTPEWVTTANMDSTVIADKFVKAAQLCVGQYAADCKAAGIS